MFFCWKVDSYDEEETIQLPARRWMISPIWVSALQWWWPVRTDVFTMCPPKTKGQYGSMVVCLIDRWRMEMKMGFVMLKKNLPGIISRLIAKK